MIDYLAQTDDLPDRIRKFLSAKVKYDGKEMSAVEAINQMMLVSVMFPARDPENNTVLSLNSGLMLLIRIAAANTEMEAVLGTPSEEDRRLINQFPRRMFGPLQSLLAPTQTSSGGGMEQALRIDIERIAKQLQSALVPVVGVGV